MSPRTFLLLMTLAAVVGDSMLHPFYPQYFDRVFGVTEPRVVALYIAACSLTVILAFPVWARIARSIPVLPMLVATQLAAGVLSIASSMTSSLGWFCAASLGMILFKASYLLIYPYVLSLEDKRQHLGTIGLLAFVVYFGNILAALLSGLVLELLPARTMFIAMACGDLLQVLLCLYQIKRPAPVLEVEQDPEASEHSPPVPHFLLKLGSIMLVMYFSAYVIEPFFSPYWEAISGVDNKVLSGFVFAIPGIAALLGLYVNTKAASAEDDAHAGIAAAILIAIGSLLLQASGVAAAVLIGRFLYGWALFQALVRLDALFFSTSTRDRYAADFAKINLFQGFGVMLASLMTGSLLPVFGTRAPFALSAGGFALGALMYWRLFRANARKPHPVTEEIVT